MGYNIKETSKMNFLMFCLFFIIPHRYGEQWFSIDRDRFWHFLQNVLINIQTDMESTFQQERPNRCNSHKATYPGIL
jgi:hypothetical protein